MWYDVNSAADRWIKFGYDGLSRLDSADYRSKFLNNNCSVDGDNGWLCDDWISSRDSLKTYSYDAVGNRTDNAGTYTTGNRVLTFAGFTFEHDLDGNVTRKYGNGQDVRYYWSAEGRLDSVVAGTVRIAYGYDPHAQLVRKRVNGVDKRFFLWHGDQLVAELDSTAQKRVGEYAYYPGVDQPLALIIGDTTAVLTRFYRQDQIGNVTGLLKDTSVVQKVTYGSWGQQQQVTGTVADTNRLRWKGLLWEGDSTRLYYMRARWYDPSVGRFFSEDPIGLQGGMNQYVFAGANPIGGRDPSGLDMECYYHQHWDDENDYYAGKPPDYEELLYCVGGGSAGSGGKGGGSHGSGGEGQPVSQGGPSPTDVLKKIACSILGLVPIPVTVSGGRSLDFVTGSGFVVGGGWFVGTSGWGTYDKRGFAVGGDVSSGVEVSMTVGSYGGTALDAAYGEGPLAGGGSVNTSSLTGSFQVGPSLPVSARVGFTHTQANYSVRCN